MTYKEFCKIHGLRKGQKAAFAFLIHEVYSKESGHGE